MTGPGLVLVTGGERLSAVDRLAAASRWVDGLIADRVESKQRREVAERKRERAARQRRRQRVARRRVLLSTVARGWWR